MHSVGIACDQSPKKIESLHALRVPHPSATQLRVIEWGLEHLAIHPLPKAQRSWQPLSVQPMDHVPGNHWSLQRAQSR